MKVFILISSNKNFNTGIGGHYRSALTLQAILNTLGQTIIISYGDLPPDVYKDLENVYHINGNISSAIKNIKQQIDQEITEKVIISFDTLSVMALYRFCKKTSATLVYCRPGGPPSKAHQIYSSIPSILFTGIDHKQFRKANPITPFFLFSARVSPPQLDEKEIRKFKSSVNWDKTDKVKRGLIVCRITKEKDQFITQACSELNNLSATEFSIVFLGTVQDTKYFNEIKETYKSIQFINDWEFVKDAAKFMWASDFTVTIGRTSQESISTGRPTFIPIKLNNKFDLYLANESIINELIEHNFTQRISNSKNIYEKNLIPLNSIAADQKKWENSVIATQQLYSRYLDPINQAEELKKFIEAASKFQKIHLKNYILINIHYCYSILKRFFIKFKRTLFKYNSQPTEHTQ